MRQHCTVILYFAIAFAGLFATHPVHAQNLTVLRKFKGPTFGDGFLPLGVVLDGKGNLFGTTGQGGTFNFGTIFKLDSHGHYSRVHSFSNTATDGGAPNGGLVVVDGNLFGTTEGGGTNRAGIVFKLDAQGVETVLYNFLGGKDGANPSGSLISDANGNLYGETQLGGNISGSCFVQGGCGTIFKIDPKTGNKSTFPLPSTFFVGALPFAGLALDSVGNLYGAAERGGDKTCGFGSPKSGCGTVFKLDSAGTFTVLHTFKNGTDGEFPTFLIRDNKTGNLFGATINGGPSNLGQLFEIDTKGKFTVLHSFKGTDGEFPGGLIISGGKIFGAVGGGGDLALCNSGCGVLFEMDTNAKNFKLLHTFKSTPEGSIPYIFLALDQAGRLYGTATEGGDSSLCGGVGCGTAYRLTLNATK